jgi:hypothetical protein
MASAPTQPFPSVSEPATSPPPTTQSSSSSSVQDEPTVTDNDADSQTLTRPRLVSRKSSGTIIVPREHPHVELPEGSEIFDEDDARAMSPRRSSQDLEKMSEDARAQLDEYVLPSPHPLSLELPRTKRWIQAQKLILLSIFQTCQNPTALPLRNLQPHRSRTRGA